MNITEKLIIDLSADGEVIEVRKNNVKVGGFRLHTTAQGRPQLQWESVKDDGESIPAITVGGDRCPSDVQFSPTPLDKPPLHLNAFALGANGQGSYGDFWIDGTPVVMPQQVFLTAANTIAPGITIDPRGGIVFGRTRYGVNPNNESLGMVRFLRRNAAGVIEECARIGIAAEGIPYINGGGNDSPRIAFEFGADWTRVLSYNPTTGKWMKVTFDNSGALKYQGPSGAVTTVAPA